MENERWGERESETYAKLWLYVIILIIFKDAYLKADTSFQVFWLKQTKKMLNSKRGIHDLGNKTWRKAKIYDEYGGTVGKLIFLPSQPWPKSTLICPLPRPPPCTDDWKKIDNLVQWFIQESFYIRICVGVVSG